MAVGQPPSPTHLLFARPWLPMKAAMVAAACVYICVYVYVHMPWLIGHGSCLVYVCVCVYDAGEKEKGEATIRGGRRRE